MKSDALHLLPITNHQQFSKLSGSEVNLVHHARAERLLMRLPLEDLLLDCADREHPVDKALLLLPVPPHPRHGLFIVGRVPVRIEHHLKGDKWSLFYLVVVSDAPGD